MQTFHVFMINNQYEKIYSRRPDALYNLLFQLNTLDRGNFEFGCQIYDQISIPFNQNSVNNHIKTNCRDLLLYENVGNIHILCNKNAQNKTKISVFNSHIKINTNDDISFIETMLSNYAKNLFVCDFNHKNYFWLKQPLKFSVV